MMIKSPEMTSPSGSTSEREMSYVLTECVLIIKSCDIVIYKKYMFSHSYVFNFPLEFLTHSSQHH